MPANLSIDAFMQSAQQLPLFDVRTPAEFIKGHIPGAVNLPVFNDEERKEIGIIYTKKGRDKAVKRGLELIGPRMRDLVDLAEKHAPAREALVHCWRGGMRSESIAWLLQFAGFSVSVLKGGYKHYRNWVLDSFTLNQPIIVLGGETGSGKTQLLEELREQGEQVIDLEGLACHKGSAFGALGEPAQPTGEQYGNILAMHWRQLDPQRPVWLEDESSRIGRINLPEPLFSRIRQAPLVLLDIGREERIRHLVSEYAIFPKDALSHCIRRIERRLGGQRTKEALQALKEENFTNTVSLILSYYDKAYRHQIEARDPKKVYHLPLKDTDRSAQAETIRDFARNHITLIPCR